VTVRQRPQTSMISFPDGRLSFPSTFLAMLVLAAIIYATWYISPELQSFLNDTTVDYAQGRWAVCDGANSGNLSCSGYMYQVYYVVAPTGFCVRFALSLSLVFSCMRRTVNWFSFPPHVVRSFRIGSLAAVAVGTFAGVVLLSELAYFSCGGAMPG
jgi:hypothetical protein